MTASLRLVPNLGGEEQADWSRMLRTPRIASAARLWRALFSRAARPIADPPFDWDAWPEALAPTRERAALPELEIADGCVAWLGDPAAHAAAIAAGSVLHGPPGERVWEVNDKAFAARIAEQSGLVPRRLRGTSARLEPAQLADPDAAEAAIDRAVSDWPDWARARPCLKPRHGTSGRGRLQAVGGRIPREALQQAGPRLARSGGALLEPWLDRRADLSVQLRVDPDGAVVVLGTLELLVGPAGGWLGHRGELDARGRVFSGHPEDERLREAGAIVARAAFEAGYHGYAGVDGLVFADPDADVDVLRPVVELNARFTMGTVAVGAIRRVLDALRAGIGLEPGRRCAFWLAADRPPAGWTAARSAAGDGALLLPLWCERDAPDAPRPALLVADSAREIDAALRAGAGATGGPDPPPRLTARR